MEETRRTKWKDGDGHRCQASLDDPREQPDSDAFVRCPSDTNRVNVAVFVLDDRVLPNR